MRDRSLPAGTGGASSAGRAGSAAPPSFGAQPADGPSAAAAGAAPAPQAPALDPQPGNASGDFDVPEAVPTGVIFDWPETDPSTAGSCKPGRYVGEYSCRLYIIDTSGDGAFDVSGTIDMQLEQTPDGELLRIADGHFASATLAAIPMSADIVGELDCRAARFEGRLENGKFSVALGLPIPFTEGTFSGPLGSDYDRDAAALTGTWNMMGMLDGFPGTCMNGAWSAHWVP